MPRLATLAAMIGLAGLLAWGVPLTKLFSSFAAMNTMLSIIVGAILVRLNRGMPTIDWKTIDADRRRGLTGAIVGLAEEYLFILGANACLLVFLVVLLGLGETQVGRWPYWFQRCGSGLIGALVGLSVSRVVYVVWRDYDVVRLQKALIDTAADLDQRAKEVEEADRRTADIRAAGLRKVGGGEVRSWEP